MLLKNKKIFCSILVIIILGILAPLSFFENDKIIIGLDEWSVLRPEYRITDWFYTWAGSSSLGRDLSTRIVNLPTLVLPFWLMSKAGLSLVLSQKLFFISIFICSGISMFYLALTLFEKKYLLALVASLVYMFNPVVGGYWASLLVPAIVCLAISPLLLSVFVKGLKSSQKWYYAILFSISTLFYPMVSPPLFAIIVLMSFGFYLYYSFINKEFRKNATYLVFCGGWYLLLNSWWMINTARLLFTSPDFMESGDSVNRLASSSLSSSFLNLFRFQTNYWGYSFWGDQVNNWVGFLLDTKPILIIGSYLLMFLAIISVWLIKKNTLVYFLAICLLVFVFLSKGLHVPFSYFYEMMFKFPLFNMFRTPAHKFPVATIMYVSLLVGASINEINHKLKGGKTFWSRSFIYLIIIAILANQWYFFTGDVLQRGKSAQPSVLVKFPSYYWQAADWLRKQKDDFRIFSLPGSDIPTLWTVYRWGFLGLYSVSSEIFERPIIDKLPQSSFDSFRWGIYALLGNYKGLPYEYLRIPPSNEVNKLLRLLSTKYLLVNHDVDWQHMHYGTEDPNLLADNLLKQNGILPEIRFNSLAFSRVENPLPKISVTGATQQISGNDLSLHYLTGFPYWHPERGSFVSEEAFLPDQYYIVPTLTNSISEDDLVTSQTINKVNLPFVRWSPQNILYKIIETKENSYLKGQTSFEQKVKARISLAGKRISEIEKWGAAYSTEETERQMQRYQKLINEINDLLNNNRNETTYEPLCTEVNLFLNAHKEKLISVSEKYNAEKRRVITQIMKNVSSEYHQNSSINNYSEKNYVFNVSREGVYRIYLDGSGLPQLPLPFISLSLDDKPISSYGLDNDKSGWYLFEGVSLSGGNHSLDLILSDESNLITGNKIADEDQNLICYFVPSESNSLYSINFGYNREPSILNYIVKESTNNGEKITKKSIFRTGNSDGSNEYVYLTHPLSKELNFCFYRETIPDKSPVVDNVVIKRLYEPNIILFSDQSSNPPILPVVDYKKINHTKYQVNVRKANQSFVLIFSESFSKEWKANINGQELPENQHLPINVFANSWLVKPIDAQNKTDYEILIEYRPQKIFYYGIAISIFVLITGIINLVVVRKNK